MDLVLRDKRVLNVLNHPRIFFNGYSSPLTKAFGIKTYYYMLMRFLGDCDDQTDLFSDLCFADVSYSNDHSFVCYLFSLLGFCLVFASGFCSSYGESTRCVHRMQDFADSV